MSCRPTTEIAAAFTMIARVEKEHEARFLKLLEHLQGGKTFVADEPTRWKCRNCGYVHDGPEAPGKCPACLHPRAYMQMRENNY